MNAVIWLMILAMCMNGFIGMAQLAFDTPLVQNGGLINFDTIINEQKEQVNQLGANSTSGLNLSLTFGDFLKGTQFVINSVTLQYFADIVQVIINSVNLSTGSGAAITTMFMWMLRAILAVISGFTIYYMVTGRGSASNV